MTERQRRRPWLYAILGTALGLFLVGFVFIIITTAQTTAAIRDTQVDNHQLLNRIVVLSHSIDDCTKPAGKCFQGAQKRTASTVGSINSEAIVRSACSVILSRQVINEDPVHLSRRISACVTDTLASLGAPHHPPHQ